MTTLWMVLAVLALWAGVAWLRRRAEYGSGAAPYGHRASPDHDADEDDGIDYDLLEQAEREVRDMDADARGHTPDSTPGDDWGPGAPRRPAGL